MTVAALRASITYIENGATLAFAAPFRFATTDLVVRRFADGAVTDLISGVDFTASGGSTDAGGTVTLVASIAGARLVIRRRTARSQSMSYTINDRFPASSHEDALDRLTMIVQEQDDAIEDEADRAIKVPEGEIAPLLPEAAARAGKFLVGLPGGGIGAAEGTGNDAAFRADAASQAIGKGASLFGVAPLTGGLINDAVDAQQALQALVDAILTTRGHFVVVDYFGLGLAWNDDWAGAFEAAAVAAGPGGVIYAPNRYSLKREPYIQPGVTVRGPWTQADEILPASAGDYDGRNGTIFFKVDGTGMVDGFNVNASCCWEGLTIMRAGLDLPFTSAAEATAGVAAFTGLAFNVAGPGVTFRNLLILGFNKAIYSRGFERTRCVGIRGDCTNGIDIQLAYDIPRVIDCEFWPYTTVHQTWTTNALLRRSGTAFYGQDVNDWMAWEQCFSYGFFRGFWARDVNTVTFDLCGADNTSSLTGPVGAQYRAGDHPGSIGFIVDGVCEEPRLSLCQAAAQEVGFFWANSGHHGTMAFCESWGNLVAGLDRRSGNLTVIGGVFRDSSYGILNEHATDYLTYQAVRFNKIRTKPVHSTVGCVGLHNQGGCDFGDWPIGSSPVTDTVQIVAIASADPLPIPATGDKFFVTGNVSYGSVSGMWAGREVTLMHTGSLTVSDGGASLQLAGNLITGGNAVLRLIGTAGSTAKELSRAVL